MTAWHDAKQTRFDQGQVQMNPCSQAAEAPCCTVLDSLKRLIHKDDVTRARHNEILRLRMTKQHANAPMGASMEGEHAQGSTRISNMERQRVKAENDKLIEANEKNEHAMSSLRREIESLKNDKIESENWKKKCDAKDEKTRKLKK